MGQCNTEVLLTLIINIHTVSTCVVHTVAVITCSFKSHTHKDSHMKTVKLHHTRGSDTPPKIQSKDYFLSHFIFNYCFYYLIIFALEKININTLQALRWHVM